MLIGLALSAAPGPPVPDITAPLLPDEPSKADLTRDREVLERWDNQAPEKAPRRMQVVYWIPSDRDPHSRITGAPGFHRFFNGIPPT